MTVIIETTLAPVASRDEAVKRIRWLASQPVVSTPLLGFNISDLPDGKAVIKTYREPQAQIEHDATLMLSFKHGSLPAIFDNQNWGTLVDLRVLNFHTGESFFINDIKNLEKHHEQG